MHYSILVLESWLPRVGAVLRQIATTLDGPGMLLVAVADSSFLSIPEGNDLLIVILSAGKSWERMAYYVAMTSLGSIVGCLLLYTVGRSGGSPVLRRRFSARSVERAEALFRRYGLLTIAIPSILPPPFPFKIFVLSAGAFRVSVRGFIFAVAVGRTVRYSIWGILAVLYGTTVGRFMHDNLPRLGLWLFLGVVGAGALGVAVHLWLKRRRRSAPVAPFSGGSPASE